MARKKDKAASSAPKATIESLSDDQLYSLTEDHKNRYLTLYAAKTAADTALKNFGRVVKADLGAQGLADIKGLIELATPEGEARMKADVERQVRLLRWMQVPIGTMGDMFADTDRTPLVERAFNEGKRQGLAGESCVNPHHHTVAAHKSHNDGWAEGQKTKATKGFSKLEPEVAGDIKKSAAIGSSRPTFEVAH